MIYDEYSQEGINYSQEGINYSFEGINVHLVDLPTTVGGLLVDNQDGTHSILLNSRLTRERNMETVAHELRHIRTGQADDPLYNEYGGAANA